uniref:THAP-type domain-containing protein n=1 Tax=Cyprinus carpio TaxID=7962 RepID=A0A8C1JKF3_CYPCA
MLKSCCVVFCTANKLTNYELKFYILSNKHKEPERRTKWLQAIRREDDQGKLWNPRTKHVYVCSWHFITFMYIILHFCQ